MSYTDNLHNLLDTPKLKGHPDWHHHPCDHEGIIPNWWHSNWWLKISSKLRCQSPCEQLWDRQQAHCFLLLSQFCIVTSNPSFPASKVWLGKTSVKWDGSQSWHGEDCHEIIECNHSKYEIIQNVKKMMKCIRNWWMHKNMKSATKTHSVGKETQLWCPTLWQHDQSDKKHWEILGTHICGVQLRDCHVSGISHLKQSWHKRKI